MPVIRGRGPGYISLCIIILAVIAASGMVAAQSLSLHGPDQGKAGETVRVDLVLDQAAEGLSGYEISLSLEDRGLGEFREVEYPPWAGINENSPLHSPEIWIKAVDTRQEVETNATGIVLATLSVYCFKDGPLAVEYGTVHIDDDRGNSYQGSAGLVIPTGDQSVAPASATPNATTAQTSGGSRGGGGGGAAGGGMVSTGGAPPTNHSSPEGESPTGTPTHIIPQETVEGTPAPAHAAGTTGDAPHSTPFPAATRASLGWASALLGIAGAVFILVGRK